MPRAIINMTPEPQPAPFIARPPKWRGHIFAGIGILLLVLSVVFYRDSLQGAYDPSQWRVTFVMGLGSLINAVKSYTTLLAYDSGRLAYRMFFIWQEVDLAYLTSVERRHYLVARYSTRIIRFRDTKGRTLQVFIDQFNSLDLRPLFEAMRPYIFTPRVDKNFSPLLFSDIYEAVPHPPQNKWLLLRSHVSRAFLYILLPAFILTAALVIFVIATKQPGFQR